MKSVVITGATSFIGIHLIKEFLKKDYYTIYAVVRPQSRNMERIPQDGRITIIESEMTEYKNIDSSIENANIFIHLAWEGTRNPYRDDKEIQQRNYECAIEAMNLSNRLGCKVFVGAGSQAEYGKTCGLVNEETLCNPVTEYGKKKLQAYQTLNELAYDNDIRFIWLRFFSLYGKFDNEGTLIMSAIKKMSRNEGLELSPCTHMWNYLYVEDAVKAIVLIVENVNANGIYNIASKENKKLRLFVEEMKEILHSNSELIFGSVSYGIDGPSDLLPDISKLCDMGWNPKVTFGEGIKKMMNNGGEINE